jgi:hypothetical protein
LASTPGGINLRHVTVSHCGHLHFRAKMFTNLLKFTFDPRSNTFHLNQGWTTRPFSLSWVACSIDHPFLDFGIHTGIRIDLHILSARYVSVLVPIQLNQWSHPHVRAIFKANKEASPSHCGRRVVPTLGTRP